MRRQFRKQREVAIPRQQRLDTMRHAYGRDASIVNHSTDDTRPVHESLQNLHEIIGLADHVV